MWSLSNIGKSFRDATDVMILFDKSRVTRFCSLEIGDGSLIEHPISERVCSCVNDSMQSSAFSTPVSSSTSSPVHHLRSFTVSIGTISFSRALEKLTIDLRSPEDMSPSGRSRIDRTIRSTPSSSKVTEATSGRYIKFEVATGLISPLLSIHTAISFISPGVGEMSPFDMSYSVGKSPFVEQ